ncbi:MAG: SpoIIE family protein phosphatase [Flavobacteriales bacterium]|jgi:PAS domain S-box-containing protein|nr:MAG: SpoIIE family protein phosphatase [Flavobacteriales bacterium]
MDLSVGLALGALPMAMLGAAVALAHAYNRLRERHEGAERDRESYLQVLEGSNDALFVIDFVNGRIHQANARAAQLLGHPVERLTRLTIFDLHPQELIRRSAERIAEAWENKGSVYADIPLVAADGERIHVECSTRVTSHNGKPAIILFARDIRGRRALEARVAEQQAMVTRQNEELLASIRYARRIQRAVLPEADGLQALCPESFILFRPRDLVSGDLFWFAEVDGRKVVAAADCTGHGVPGALLSLIGAALFQEIVRDRRTVEPAAILDALREGFMQVLNRNEGASHRDGMNVSVAALDAGHATLRFAGAYHPLYLLRDGAITELKGDRMPIGIHEGEVAPFTQQEVALLPGDRIYLFSDGITDQFGGAAGKKLRGAGFRQWLLDTASLSMEEQHQALSDRFRIWKGEEEQVDDVLLIGIQA